MRRAAALLMLAVLASGCGAAALGQANVAPSRRSASRGSASVRLRETPVGSDPVLARLGLVPVGTGSPLPGYLMIADRDNNRVIAVSPARRIVWRFAPAGSAVTGAFSQPDDAFVSADGRDISRNQEFAETITLISLTRQPRIIW